MESEETDEDAHDRFAGKRLSHKERRKLRLAERTHTIISEVLLKKFSAHPHLRPTEMGLTRVEAAIDLKSVTIMWLPHNPEKKELIEKSLEKSKGQLRWYLTERLSYLRHSPQLNFQYDEILLESDRTERLLDEIAS